MHFPILIVIIWICPRIWTNQLPNFLDNSMYSQQSLSNSLGISWYVHNTSFCSWYVQTIPDVFMYLVCVLSLTCYPHFVECGYNNNTPSPKITIDFSNHSQCWVVFFVNCYTHIHITYWSFGKSPVHPFPNGWFMIVIPTFILPNILIISSNSTWSSAPNAKSGCRSKSSSRIRAAGSWCLGSHTTQRLWRSEIDAGCMSLCLHYLILSDACILCI